MIFESQHTSCDFVRILEAGYFCSDDQGKFTYWSRVS